MTGETLRALLSSGAIVVAPGAYDALSARLAARAGARAVYMTGFGVSGSVLGMPDVGLLTATEMADRARAMAAAARPAALVADADNGHGGVLNVERMVRLYEQAGVQCIQLEDQVFPKRCGHMANKEVIDAAEAAAKIAVAVQTRSSAEFLVMARTDARAPLGLDEALRRGERFLAAGADILFIEAPQSLEELRLVAERFGGTALAANMVEDGKTPFLSAAELEALGFRLVIYPVSALLAVTETLRRVYADVEAAGGPMTACPRVSFQDYNRLVGLDELLPAAMEEQIRES